MADDLMGQARRRAHELVSAEVAGSDMDMFDVRTRLQSLISEAECNPRRFLYLHGAPRPLQAAPGGGERA